MAFVTIEDGRGDVEVTAFPRVLETGGDLLVEERLVGVSVSAGSRNGELNLVAEEVFPLSDVPRRAGLAVTLKLDGSGVCEEQLDAVLRALGAHPGEAPVRFEVVDSIGSIVVLAGERFHVTPGDPLRASLAAMRGVLEVSFGNGT